MSPNSTAFIGFENYERVLGITAIVQSPQERNGNISRAGEPVYERIRDITRIHSEYRGYKPLGSVDLWGKRVVVLASDPDFLHSLFNTFLFAFMVVPVQCGAALALALIVNAGLKGQTIVRAVYFSPVVMSMVVVSVVWAFLFNKDNGLLNQLLSWLSFGQFMGIDWLGNENTAMPSIALMSAWQGAGFQMLIFLAGLQGISRELYDAAMIDGATAWQRFTNVTLPGLRHTTAFVVLVTTIAAFGLFTQVDIMTQGGPRNTTSTVMFHAVQRGVREQDIAYGSTVTVIYFVIIAAIALFQHRYFARRTS
jgi:multiple sugar transport system permease protein